MLIGHCYINLFYLKPKLSLVKWNKILDGRDADEDYGKLNEILMSLKAEFKNVAILSISHGLILWPNLITLVEDKSVRFLKLNNDISIHINKP